MVDGARPVAEQEVAVAEVAVDVGARVEVASLFQVRHGGLAVAQPRLGAAAGQQGGGLVGIAELSLQGLVGGGLGFGVAAGVDQRAGALQRRLRHGRRGRAQGQGKDRDGGAHG